LLFERGMIGGCEGLGKGGLPRSGASARVDVAGSPAYNGFASEFLIRPSPAPQMAAPADLFKRAVQAFQQGRLEDAERAFRQLLRKEPRHLPSLNILAIVLTTLKKYREAEGHLQTALKLNSSSDATFYNYGLVLKALGRPDEAMQRFTEALALNPGNADSWNNRGTVQNDLGDYRAAIADFDQAIALNPKSAAAFFNKSKSLSKLKRHAEALAASEQALALQPDLAEAWYGRGMVFHELQRHDEAAGAILRALQIDPRLPFLKGSLLHQKMLTCDWAEVDSLIREIETDIAAGRPAAEPFGWQGVARSEKSLQRCAELYNAKMFPAGPAGPAVSGSGASGKIRVGYLSGEFRQQATSLLLVGALEHHDAQRFEIHAFDNGWDDQSETRRRIGQSVHRLIDIAQLNDAGALAAIRDSRIDVLVNLNGYFGQGRTRLFAQRAAPLQVNYLGYPGTLGASYMDYIIADRHVIPESERVFYSEKVVYLPNCYQANDRNKPIAERVFSRQECGLPAHEMVFCCFNNAYKITPEIFDGWMKILSSVEGSVLWLLEDTASAAAHLRREAVARGVSADRLVFAARMPLPEHLSRHRCADLFLDTLPYNAHTTASDALWAGLPVLTCRGQTFAGRVAASLLHNVGLPELVTATLDGYVRLAIELARQPAKRAAVKQKLQANRLTTPLFDTRLFTAHLEQAYAAMVERHRAGLAPDHIAVPS
jgi:predicted O-linked N-acetylglucosamine transferase (SPINDLY family)